MNIDGSNLDVPGIKLALGDRGAAEMHSSTSTSMPSRWYPVSKRSLDLLFSLLGLVLFAPFGVLIAAVIKLTDRGPVFYRQLRIGLGGKPFGILKFRSMVSGAENLGPSVTQERDPRITGIGRILRRTKLDELPQLWNVFVGEMSFVGPRPEVPRYVDLYTPEQRNILKFKPGITDLATLVFRNEETLLRNATNVEDFYVRHCIPRKFHLNWQYAARASLFQDIRIILETLCPSWLAVAAGYSLVLTASLWLSYQLRFDFRVPPVEQANLWRLEMMVVPVQILFLFWRRQFAGLLSYFDVPEMKHLAIGLGQAAAVQFSLWIVSNGVLMPGRSIIFIDAGLAFILLGGTRSLLRTWRETRTAKLKLKIKRTLPALDSSRLGVVGAGELGAWLARQINVLGNGRGEVVAFFDDDADKWNKHLCEVPVVGMPECILDGSWAGRLDAVILAVPGASEERQKQIIQILGHANIRAHLMPSIEDVLTK